MFHSFKLKLYLICFKISISYLHDHGFRFVTFFSLLAISSQELRVKNHILFFFCRSLKVCLNSLHLTSIHLVPECTGLVTNYKQLLSLSEISPAPHSCHGDTLKSLTGGRVGRHPNICDHEHMGVWAIGSLTRHGHFSLWSVLFFLYDGTCMKYGLIKCITPFIQSEKALFKPERLHRYGSLICRCRKAVQAKISQDCEYIQLNIQSVLK